MEIREIENIEPKEVLSWFKKICAIPHGSTHEEAISKWLAQTCKELGCEVKVYPSGMILAKQKASQGCENWPTTLLQSHMDMVLAKREKSDVDLLTTPIEPVYDTEKNIIRAIDTTLGADDGIGMAISLAIMSNKELVHGPLEHLITVNEESLPGDCVTKDVNIGDLNAKFYLNIDAETMDDITYGSAGCSTMKYAQNLDMEQSTSKSAYRISLTGLKGGHSGVNISRPHINPIEFLSQVLFDCSKLNKHPIRICGFDGGPIENSLPTYAKVDIIVDDSHFEKIKRFAISQLLIAKKVAQGCEDGVILSFDKIDAPEKTCTIEQTKNILLFATLAPNKVFTGSISNTDMFSSSNLGRILIKDDKAYIDFKVRSFVDADVQRTIRKIASLGVVLGFNNYLQQGIASAFLSSIQHNVLAKEYANAYKKIVGKTPRNYIVPAGLECAAVCLKNPTMTVNTISVGVNLSNCHSPDECASLDSIVKFWEIIKLLLTKLNK